MLMFSIGDVLDCSTIFGTEMRSAMRCDAMRYDTIPYDTIRLALRCNDTEARFRVPPWWGSSSYDVLNNALFGNN